MLKPSFRSLVILFALLLGLPTLFGLLSCGNDPAVIVTVVGRPAAATHLQVSTAVDGVAGQEVRVDGSGDMFVLRFPSDETGTVKVDVAALDDNGTKLGIGTATVDLPSGVRRYVEVTVVLTPASSLTVTLQYGRAHVTSDPAGIDCSDTNPGGCQATFGIGTTVALTVQPDRQVLGWTWAGDCTTQTGGTTMGCSVMMTSGQQRQVQVRVAARVCSEAGWCWSNPLPQGNALRATWAAAPDDVWAIGELGTILKANYRPPISTYT